MKTVGGLRKLRHRGGELVDWIVTFTAAAYNLIPPADAAGEGVVSATRPSGPRRGPMSAAEPVGGLSASRTWDLNSRFH